MANRRELLDLRREGVSDNVGAKKRGPVFDSRRSDFFAHTWACRNGSAASQGRLVPLPLNAPFTTSYAFLPL